MFQLEMVKLMEFYSGHESDKKEGNERTVAKDDGLAQSSGAKWAGSKAAC
jgi:hypothetical protein